MEFKGYNDDGYLISESNINRIKVEFKDKFLSDSGRNQSILIESKWNLKAS